MSQCMPFKNLLPFVKVCGVLHKECLNLNCLNIVIYLPDSTKHQVIYFPFFKQAANDS